jgi:hypothetical protein
VLVPTTTSTTSATGGTGSTGSSTCTSTRTLVVRRTRPRELRRRTGASTQYWYSTGTSATGTTALVNFHSFTVIFFVAGVSDCCDLSTSDWSHTSV